MKKFDYVSEMTILLMGYKSRLDGGILTHGEVDTLISILMSEVIYKDKMNKMLDYAWDNCGEVLTVKEIVN